MSKRTQKPMKPSNSDFEHSLSLRQRVFRAEEALARANMAYVKAWLRYLASEDSHDAGAGGPAPTQSAGHGTGLSSAAEGSALPLLPSAEAAQAGTTSGAHPAGGDGTTTSAELGRAQGQGPEGEPQPRAPSAAEMSAARAGKTILVVDDEADVRYIIRAVLEGAGYLVREAGNGQEALDVVAPASFLPTSPTVAAVPVVAVVPAAIILDCLMPLMDGWAFARLYGALPVALSPHPQEKAPLLVLTAAHDVERRAREIGAIGWVGKPFRLDVLLAEVDRLALSLPARSERSA